MQVKKGRFLRVSVNAPGRKNNEDFWGFSIRGTSILQYLSNNLFLPHAPCRIRYELTLPEDEASSLQAESKELAAPVRISRQHQDSVRLLWPNAQLDDGALPGQEVVAGVDGDVRLPVEPRLVPFLQVELVPATEGYSRTQ